MFLQALIITILYFLLGFGIFLLLVFLKPRWFDEHHCIKDDDTLFNDLGLGCSALLIICLWPFVIIGLICWRIGRKINILIEYIKELGEDRKE